jgi:hypothetical protein
MCLAALSADTVPTAPFTDFEAIGNVAAEPTDVVLVAYDLKREVIHRLTILECHAAAFKTSVQCA